MSLNSSVAIIVLNWNGGKDTVECLASLARLTYPAVNIIVIDNGSTDDSVARIKSAYPDLDLIETGANLGFAEGNNVGVRHAQKQGADYILLLNNDTIVSPDLIEQFVDAAEHYPDAGIFTAKIYYYAKPEVLWYAGSKWDSENKVFSHLGKGEKDDQQRFDKIVDTEYACGCALFLRASLIPRLGLMDQRFFLTYEETDWCYRARAMGIRILLVPGARLWHKVSVSFGGSGSPLQSYFFSRNRLLWAERHLARKEYFGVLGYTLREVFGWNPGATPSGIFKRYYWSTRSALRRVRKTTADPVTRAKFLGLRDYLLRRFGNCPGEVRALSGGKEMRVGFVPWWTENPYQLQLRGVLRSLNYRVIGNPPLSLLRTLINRDGLDVVHLHWFRALYSKSYWKMPYAMLLLLCYRLRKNNLCWTVHELDLHESRYPGLDELFVRFLMKITRVLLVHSDHSVAEIRKRFAYHGHIVAMKHASYAGIYPDTLSKQEARQHFGLEDDHRVFLYFGYIRPYKGVGDLIEAFIKSAGDQDRLLIAGKPLNSEIEETVKGLIGSDERISLDLRYVPDEDIQLYFKAADIVVYPFRYTHTSGSLMLALSFGRPVIAPNIASIPEYIDAHCGVLFNPDDPNALAAAIRSVTTLDLGAMARTAQDRAAGLTWTDMASKHAEAYRLITENKS